MENTVVITVFILFNKVSLNIDAKRWIWIGHIKIKENILLHMSNTFLEIFLKY